MKKITTVLTASALTAAFSGPLAADCDTSYRIWQDGTNTYYSFGEEIVLQVGDQVDLYLHAYDSGAKNPYRASAKIGTPAELGVGRHGPRDVQRFLSLRNHDARKGKISLTAVAAGRTALGYHITDVFAPGQLGKVPERCRGGRVLITVEDANAVAPGPAPRPEATGDAANRLIAGLFTGILRRSEGEVGEIPRGFADQVRRGGMQGLISVAESMTSSPEFRDWSLARTGQALEASGVSAQSLSREVLENQLLSDIYTSLYGGGVQPYGDARRRMAGYLSSCISGRGGNDACPRLGRDLVTQPQYQARNDDLLRYLR